MNDNFSLFDIGKISQERLKLVLGEIVIRIDEILHIKQKRKEKNIARLMKLAELNFLDNLHKIYDLLNTSVMRFFRYANSSMNESLVRKNQSTLFHTKGPNISSKIEYSY